MADNCLVVLIKKWLQNILLYFTVAFEVCARPWLDVVANL